MSKKTTLAAGTSPFAHLLGGAAALAGRALGRRAEEDEKPEGEEGDDEPDAEDEPADEPEKGKKGKAKGESDDDDASAEDDETDVDAEEPEDEKEAKAYRAGVAAANKRASQIFLSPAAAGRPDLAAQLAFGSRVSASEAIGLLTAAGAGAPKPRGRLDDRMGNRTEPRPGAGTGAGGKGEANFADQMAAALKKAGR